AAECLPHRRPAAAAEYPADGPANSAERSADGLAAAERPAHGPAGAGADRRGDGVAGAAAELRGDGRALGTTRGGASPPDGHGPPTDWRCVPSGPRLSSPVPEGSSA